MFKRKKKKEIFFSLMEKAVGHMHMLEVIVYIDDLFIFGKTLE